MQYWYCSLPHHPGVSPLQFLSIFAYVQNFVHNPNLDFLFPPGTSSTVTSSPSLMSLSIVSLLKSIRLRAANFPPIWVWNTWLNVWFPKFIQVKTNTDALGAASDFQLHLEVCKHKVIITCHLWHQGKVLCLPCWWWDLKLYWTRTAMVALTAIRGGIFYYWCPSLQHPH